MSTFKTILERVWYKEDDLGAVEIQNATINEPATSQAEAENAVHKRLPHAPDVCWEPEHDDQWYLDHGYVLSEITVIRSNGDILPPKKVE
jgi:hypothetical protein